jgi:mRNA-degrading endonuclease YafQ of YafQ-DinJ toxin-antitoxin module
MKSRYQINATDSYNRKIKKIVKKDAVLYHKVERTLNILSNNPFAISLKTHVIGNSDWGRVYSSRVNGDVRILWDFDGKNIILLHTIGRHSGNSKVYK